MLTSADVLSAHFSHLSQPWQLTFELAWEAFTTGNPGIGAVVVDSSDAVVSTGRNRRADATAPPGQVAGTGLAHAEINALASLPYGRHTDHRLLTTLEPCFMCTAALRMNRVGTVEFAAADPLWRDIERVTEVNPHIARRWTRRMGPMEAPLRDWAALLHLIRYPETEDTGVVVDEYRSAMPGLMALAQQLVAGDHLETLRKVPLAEAFGIVADVASHMPVPLTYPRGTGYAFP
jgi:tRNA(adenine34) deaminase